MSQRALRLAAVAERLGEAAWRADAERVAGAPASPPGDGPIPTYGEVARLGTGVVVALTDEQRWDEAVVQARHLLAFFARTGFVLGPIAVEAFDGLLAACLAHDPDEVRDFAELVGELFP